MRAARPEAPGRGGAAARAVADRGGSLDRSRAPVPGPPLPLRFPEVRRFTLSNGLSVRLVEKHDLPLVALEVILPGGAGAVAPSRAGLAALTADLLDEGAGARSALAIAAELERLGAWLHPAAGYDDGHVELLALRPRLEGALDLFTDVLLRPTFAQSELERVRQERIDRARQLRDEPRSVANDALACVLYGPEHPWGLPLLGTRRSLARVDRAEVVSHYHDRYHAGNAAVVVAGDVTEAELRILLEPRLGGWVARPARPVTVPPAPARERATVYLVDRPGSVQSEVRVGRVAVARGAADYFPILVLNTVLGGAFTSRLNARLREEKGFTYGARSGFHTRRAPGPFVAQAAVHTPVTAEAVGVVIEELERLREEPVPDEELARARCYVALRLPQRFETVGDLVGRMAEQVLHDLPDDYWESYVARLLEVDAPAVQEAARRHLNPRGMAIVVDGDRAVVERPLRDLGMPVEVRPGEVA